MDTKKITGKVDSSKPLLVVENLNMYFKTHGSYYKAIDDISFSVNKGDFFGIIGESGSGKTTTGKTIVRLNIPSSGKIVFDDHLISGQKISRKENKWLRKNVQMIFQDPASSLNPTKNVMELISEPLVINRSLWFDTYFYFSKIFKVCKYFKYNFDKTRFNLFYEYNKKFLVNYIMHIENAKTKLSDLINVKFSSGEIKNYCEAIRNHVDELVNGIENSLDDVYLYENKFKDVINGYISAYDNQQLEEVDLNLNNALNSYKKAKFNYKYSSFYQKLKIEYLNLIKKHKDYSDEFKNKYLVKNFNLILNWLDTIKNNFRKFSQNYKLANSEVDHIYGYINYCLWKQLKFYALKFKKFIHLDEEFILNSINEIVGCVSSNYELLSKKCIELDNKFSESLSIQEKQMHLKNLFKIKQLSRLLYLSGVKDDIKFFNNNISKHLRKFQSNLDNFDSVLSRDQISEMFSKVINRKIADILANARKISDSNLNSHKEIVDNFNKERMNLKAQLKKEKENFKEQLDLQNSLKKILTDEKQHLKIVRRQRKDFINEYKKTLPEFKSDKRKKYKELRDLKIKINKNIFYIKILLFKLFKKVYFAKRNEYNKLSTNFLKNIKNSWSYTKESKLPINLRLREIKIVDFEVSKVNSEIEVYRKIFWWPNFVSWIFFFSFFKILKKEKVYEALENVGLKREHAFRYPHEFSGGQKQRIVIARALITKPQLIIADEPISALDVSIQAQIVNIMKKMSVEKNITFLFIAHDLSMINYACNNLIIMHRGRILERGNVDEIFSNPVHPYTKSLMKASPKLSKIHVNLASFDEEFDYDKDYSLITNSSKFKKIEGSKNHEIFGTDEQIRKWLGEV